MKHSKQQVSVFGNEVEPMDSLVVELVPDLQKQFPHVNFRIEDPTETLEPTGDPWIILDMGMGIEDVLVIDNLLQLDRIKGQSVHDFDVYMELRLREKLGQLPQIRIVIVPLNYPKKQALDEIVVKLQELL